MDWCHNCKKNIIPLTDGEGQAYCPDCGKTDITSPVDFDDETGQDEDYR